MAVSNKRHWWRVGHWNTACTIVRSWHYIGYSFWKAPYCIRIHLVILTTTTDNSRSVAIGTSKIGGDCQNKKSVTQDNKCRSRTHHHPKGSQNRQMNDVGNEPHTLATDKGLGKHCLPSHTKHLCTWWCPFTFPQRNLSKTCWNATHEGGHVLLSPRNRCPLCHAWVFSSSLALSPSPVQRRNNNHWQISTAADTLLAIQLWWTIANLLEGHILGWRKHCDSHHIQHRRPCWRHAERT